MNGTDHCTNGVDRLNDELSGGYFYAGNGDWSHIKSVERVDDGIEFRTRSVSYESVPHDLRELAYEQHEGDGRVIVHSDEIDLPRKDSADTDRRADL